MFRLMSGSGRRLSAHSCICLRGDIARLTATCIEALALITERFNRRRRGRLESVVRRRAPAVRQAVPAVRLHLKYPHPECRILRLVAARYHRAVSNSRDTPEFLYFRIRGASLELLNWSEEVES